MRLQQPLTNHARNFAKMIGRGSGPKTDPSTPGSASTPKDSSMPSFAENPQERNPGEVFRRHEGNLAKNFADFCPEFPRKLAARNYTKNPRQIPRAM